MRRFDGKRMRPPFGVRSLLLLQFTLTLDEIRIRRGVTDQRVDSHEPLVDRRHRRRDLRGQIGARGTAQARSVSGHRTGRCQTFDETRALGRIDKVRGRQRIDLGIGDAGGVAEQTPKWSIDDDGRIGIVLAYGQTADIDAFVNAVEQAREGTRARIVRNRRARARQTRRL